MSGLSSVFPPRPQNAVAGLKAPVTAIRPRAALKKCDRLDLRSYADCTYLAKLVTYSNPRQNAI